MVVAASALRRTRVLALVVLLLAPAALAGCFGRGGDVPEDDAGDDVLNSTAGADPHPTEAPPATEEDEDEATNGTAPPAPETPPTNATPPVPVGVVGGDAHPAPLAEPVVVIALVDSGINPYHREFRDLSPLAYRHPATYLPGYPADAQALPITLDQPDLAAALEKDDALWKDLKPDTLYWVPGTRVIGLMSVSQDGARFGFDENGHGTMTASRAAGLTTSLAPTARIVAIEGLTPKGATWAAAQPWIDVQSHSWGELAPNPGTRLAFADAAAEMPIFVASGNGLATFFGGVGQPSTLGSNQGASGVIAVGGHDNGMPTPWTGSVPHVVADACWSWAADAATTDVTGPRVGSGTSAAAPYAAGAAAQLILEARALLGDVNVSHVGGVLARGAAGRVAEGPLADGDLTLQELKDVLLKTADPRARATAHDGEPCDVFSAPYATLPAEWALVPAEAPLYYFVGYGAVNVDTLGAARAVLRGEAPVPSRAEDSMSAADATLRGLIG